jgi:succinate dehydrogenase / fumarate reductase cytochrome b subunit
MRMEPTESRKSTYAKLWERTLSDRRMGVGSYVWSLHRVTGFVLLVYLAAHLVVLGSILQGGGSFDNTMSVLSNPGVKVGETILIWVALLHATNGIRLVALDVAPSLNQRALAYGVAGATVVLGTAAAFFIW